MRWSPWERTTSRSARSSPPSRSRSGVLGAVPGHPVLLDGLRATVRVGLVSDGDVHIPRGKLRAIHLQGTFDVVVWPDEPALIVALLPLSSGGG